MTNGDNPGECGAWFEQTCNVVQEYRMRTGDGDRRDTIQLEPPNRLFIRIKRAMSP